jgi:hypothetical protein
LRGTGRPRRAVPAHAHRRPAADRRPPNSNPNPNPNPDPNPNPHQELASRAWRALSCTGPAQPCSVG